MANGWTKKDIEGLETYDVKDPDISPEEPGQQSYELETYDREEPRVIEKPSKWERVKGYVGEKVQTYRTERAAIKEAKREARREQRLARAGERFQRRVDRARAPSQPFAGIKLNPQSAAQGRNFLGNMIGFGMQQKSSPLGTPKSFRTKTVYKKVGKHYKKVTRRIPIKARIGTTPQSSGFGGFFGGLNGLGSVGQSRQTDMSFGLGHLARGMNGTTKGKKKGNGSNPFNFRIGF